MTLPYRHVTDHCFAEDIGARGLSHHEYEPILAACAPALEQVRAWYGDGKHPFLTVPRRRDDLPVIEREAARLRDGFDSAVVLGTGGSSLGGRTLTALVQSPFGKGKGARVHFAENVDGRSLAAMLDGLDLKRTAFVAISKSGGTVETLSQFLVCWQALEKAVGGKAAEHVLAVTQPGRSALRTLADARMIRVLDHDPDLGGRFSALSIVGLLPAMVAGLDGAAVRAGAARVLDATLGAKTPADSAPAVGAAISVALQRHKGVNATVLMPYVDSLAPFGLWFRQLWAESLGKNSKGTTPIDALGTVDQHSQLQLYLDGPADKLITIVALDSEGTGAAIPADPALAKELDWLFGRTLGDLMHACQHATWKTLANAGRPVRLIRLPVLDGRAMGAMMMHFMLETVIAAHLLGVDPFDQPAVEAGKVLARRYLAEKKPA
jgi:glucose-6-phosphate isomerase